MTNMLTRAKAAADNPDPYSLDELCDALAYLEKTRINGGVRNSERAQRRLEQRISSLTYAIERRGHLMRGGSDASW